MFGCVKSNFNVFVEAIFLVFKFEKNGRGDGIFVKLGQMLHLHFGKFYESVTGFYMAALNDDFHGLKRG